MGRKPRPQKNSSIIKALAALGVLPLFLYLMLVAAMLADDKSADMRVASMLVFSLVFGWPSFLLMRPAVIAHSKITRSSKQWLQALFAPGTAFGLIPTFLKPSNLTSSHVVGIFTNLHKII